MAGDKGSEAPDDGEFVHNEKGANDALDYYKQDPNQNAAEAIAKAKDALPDIDRVQLPTNETS